MKYEEKYPNAVISILVLIAIFAVLYSPWLLGLRELLGSEGRYAAIALNMHLMAPSTIAHGDTLSYCYPLYPWIVAIVYKMGIGLELGLRGVSVLALGIIGIVTFETGRRIAGIQEGIIAAAAVIANICVLEKANDGNPFTLAVLILFLAWLTWYTFGAVRGNWDIAWMASLFLCGLAFYAIGWMAILYFFVPLVFMRRPLTVWKKLRFRGFSVGVCILVFFVLLWVIPRMVEAVNNPFDSYNIFKGISPHYFRDFLLFPFSVIGGFMPWSILAWPAFCVAYYPLDKNPIFSRFLRTIFLSLFVLIWLNPFREAREIIILVPPIAVLVGINYWLVVRRNGYGLHKLLHIITIVVFILALISFLLFWVPLAWWDSSFVFKWIHISFLSDGISFLKDRFVWGIVQTSLGMFIGLCLFIAYYKKLLSVWLHSLGICLVFMLCFWSVTYPYRMLSDDGKVVAATFIKSLGENYSHDMTIYKGNDISNIYALGCYLGCNIKNIDELPPNKKTIYLLSLGTPVYSTRQWENVANVSYKGKILYLWEGTIINKKFAWGN